MIYRVSHKSKIIKGQVTLPASKSISNRLLIIKSLGKLSVELFNLSTAKDTSTLQKCLHELNSKTVFDVGHGGTTMRFLTALFAGMDGERVLTGSDRMKQRPIAGLIECLRELGADITYIEQEGFPPLNIKGKKLSGGKIKINAGISSQYISAVMMIAPYLSQPLEIELEGELVSKPYIEMTLQLMNQFGADVKWTEKGIYCLNKPYTNHEQAFSVEADWSSASYLYLMLALAGEGELKISGLRKNSLQADAACMELFGALGVRSDFINDDTLVLTKTSILKNELNIDFSACPDIAQTLAVVMAGKGIKGKLTGLKTLKIKETDRINAIQNELKKTGIETEVTNESLRIISSNIQPASDAIRTYHDHRMALAFAPLALTLEFIDIEDPQVVEKSYPEYWDHLKKLGFMIEEVSAS